MSSGLRLDTADTVYEERTHKLSLKNKNWLRHGKNTSAGKIDEMLFDGVTIDKMAKGAKTTKGTVYVHLNHLRKVHKLSVMKNDGLFMYDIEGMNRIGNTGRKSPKKK